VIVDLPHPVALGTNTLASRRRNRDRRNHAGSSSRPQHQLSMLDALKCAPSKRLDARSSAMQLVRQPPWNSPIMEFSPPSGQPDLVLALAIRPVLTPRTTPQMLAEK
jgi:hypothetical protein